MIGDFNSPSSRHAKQPLKLVIGSRKGLRAKIQNQVFNKSIGQPLDGTSIAHPYEYLKNKTDINPMNTNVIKLAGSLVLFGCTVATVTAQPSVDITGTGSGSLNGVGFTDDSFDWTLTYSTASPYTALAPTARFTLC